MNKFLIAIVTVSILMYSCAIRPPIVREDSDIQKEISGATCRAIFDNYIQVVKVDDIVVN